jgi:hypothetical protein
MYTLQTPSALPPGGAPILSAPIRRADNSPPHQFLCHVRSLPYPQPVWLR